MTFLQSTIRILLPAIVVSLTSCIDGREEVWIEADGSGRAEITYTLPAAVARLHGGEAGFREMINGAIKESPEITSSHCEVLTDDDQLHVKVQVSFDSALDLKKVAEGPSLKKLPTAASHLAGIVKAEFHGRTLDFSRTISPGKALPGSSFLPASQFAGRRLVYIMHLPVAVTDSNASRVEDSGRTLVWDMPLDQALKAPIVTRFKVDIPVPWKLVGSVALPLSLAGGFVFLRLRKARASK